jgi:sucrose-6F-phosphate phosphohydrolase
LSTASFLLCTDLDRTLLPNGPQPESPQARERFKALVAHEDLILTFVTGRHRELVEAAMEQYQLPQPDFVISDVGTTIYDLRSGQWQIWEQWQQEIAPDWKGLSRLQLQQLLTIFSGQLTPQEAEKQNRFKLSYYVSRDFNWKSLNRSLATCLEESGIDASLVWSVDEEADIGLLDILPQRATKLHAVEFLQKSLDIPLEHTLFAGDSGNDLPVLSSCIPSVLVANAMESVVADALSAASSAGNRAALYLAKGDFYDMNGNYSAGILEGVAQFHPELIPRFMPEQAVHG